MAAWGEGLQSRTLFDKSQAPAVIKSHRSNRQFGFGFSQLIWIFYMVTLPRREEEKVRMI